jgi:putative ABC transport system permease protein
MALFVLLAPWLAAVGVYEVIAYTVAQHRREIGLRLALGAQTKLILSLIVGQALKLTVIVLGIGLPAAFALSRLLVSVAFGVFALDPLTFVGSAALLTGVALLSSSALS